MFVAKCCMAAFCLNFVLFHILLSISSMLDVRLLIPVDIVLSFP